MSFGEGDLHVIVAQLKTENARLKQQLDAMPGIVRCRDCVHGIKADLSGNWYECMKPDGNGDYARCDVEPDGFCAWGERKEGGE